MKPYNSYKEYLISKYGYPVYRIGVDGGFSCPNRDASRKGGCVFCDNLGSSATYSRRLESRFTRKSDFTLAPPQSGSVLAELTLEDRLESIRGQISKGKAFIKERYGSEKYSLYFQAYSNTYAPLPQLRTIYDTALDAGPFVELIISTRPDCLSDEVLDLLASYKGRVDELWLELGLQSGSDRVLKLMNRGHDVNCYIDAAKRAKNRGLKICSHVILGFPTETDDEINLTAKVVNESGIDALKIHNLHITSQSKLLLDYYQGEIAAGSMARHVENTIYFLRRIRPEIVIERLICETPSHRLAAPRAFLDKTSFLLELEKKMSEYRQGDLCVKGH